MSEYGISVVVPVYNSERFLGKCLNSILNQTYKNFELICVDDCSTDKSLEILREYERTDSRVHVICNDKPSGSAAVPRNIGLAYSSGKYLSFLDSDDFFDQNMFQEMFDYAEQHSCDLVMCDNYIIDYESEEIISTDGEIHHNVLPDLDVFSYKDIPERIFQISNATGWHKLISARLIKDNGLKYQEHVPILDDVFFINALLVEAKRIGIVDKKLVYYRTGAPGAQTSKIGKHKESVFYCFYELIKYLKAREIYDEVKKSLVNWILITMQWWLYSITSYKIYYSLFELYQNEYFEKLDLLNIDEALIEKNLVEFYKAVAFGEIHPSISMVLEDQIAPNSKIVLYGAGKVGRQIYDMVTKQGLHEVCLWCDANANNIKDDRIKEPSYIQGVEYDLVIIGIANPDVVKEVKEYLSELGVSSEKIYQAY